jgi:chromosome segregation ATPase
MSDQIKPTDICKWCGAEVQDHDYAWDARHCAPKHIKSLEDKISRLQFDCETGRAQFDYVEAKLIRAENDLASARKEIEELRKKVEKLRTYRPSQLDKSWRKM